MEHCPELSELHAWLDEQLSPERQQELSIHVSKCPVCGPLMDEAAVGGFEAEWRAGLVGVAGSAPAQQSATVSSPPVIPGFEVLEQVGRGGMGVVYKAKQARPQLTVALKVIPAARFASDCEKARFFKEADSIANLTHPNIVRIYAVGEHENVPYYSMELLEEGTLAEQLKGTPMSPAAAAAMVEAIALGVQHAHEHGIVHRDLKPGNVLLAGGQPKVADFGLAKRVDEEEGLTSTGIIVGTPEYMPPEQARGEKQVGPAADVYALGAMLYECLTGHPPLRGGTRMETLQLVLHTDPVPPSQAQPKLPRDLETICLKCLRKEVAGRYADAGRLAEDLRRYLEGRPIVARRVGVVEQGWRWCRRNPSRAALVGLVGVMAVLAGWWVQERQVRRVEQVRMEERLRGEVQGMILLAARLRDQGRFREAEELLKQAGDKAEQDGVAGLGTEVAQANAELRTVEELDTISSNKATVADQDDSIATAHTVRGYAAIFGVLGLDFRLPTVRDHVTSITSSPLRDRLVAALDDWAAIEASKEVQERILEVARPRNRKRAGTEARACRSCAANQGNCQTWRGRPV